MPLQTNVTATLFGAQFHQSFNHRTVFALLKKRSLIALLCTGLMMAISDRSNSATVSGSVASKLVPILSMLLDDNRPFLRLGVTNLISLDNQAFPLPVAANFGPVNDGLRISFDVSGLSAGESLMLLINGRQIAEVSTNGLVEFEIANSILYAGSENSLEFVSQPASASWQVNQIGLFNAEGPFTRSEAVRFLNKATFGASESSISRLLSLGYSAWIDEQLQLTPTFHTPFYLTAVDERAAVGISGASQRCAAKMDSWWNGAVRGPDQLRQRMAFALSEVFVIGDSACNVVRRHGFTNYYDILIRNAFGSYRTLLEDVTLNPMMGAWLSLKGSNVNPVYGNSADENYAREVMQLFSIGVFQLNLDGSLKLSNGQPIETYDNETITNMARALTGWQSDDNYSGVDTVLYPMTPWNGLNARWHDAGEKTILDDVFIPAGGTIIDDLNVVLDTIAAHNNVAPFISEQLIQRFITSNPSPAYIARVASVFNDNGKGAKGDLGAVIKAILLDQDALNSHQNLDGGKMKEPLLMVSQIWRAFDAQSPIKYIRFMHTDRDLGQRPMGAATVFNFYRPDYAPVGELTSRGLVAPELYLLNDGQLLALYPKLQSILDSTISIDPSDIISGNYHPSFNINLQLNLTKAKSLATNTSELMDYFDELMFGGLMSTGLRNLVADYIENQVVYDDPTGSEEWRERKVEEALSLLGVSPEYMVQK